MTLIGAAWQQQLVVDAETMPQFKHHMTLLDIDEYVGGEVVQ